MFQIKRWLGLNEATDGDTRLKLGEAAELRNWRITANGSLQIRPGTQMKRRFGATVDDEWVGDEIKGMWYGWINNANRLVVAAGTKIYEVDPTTTVTDTSDPHYGEWSVTQLAGSVAGHAEFFQYEGCVYMMDGTSYLKWDGTNTGFVSVAGYIPTILTGCAPSNGAGNSAEGINLLNGYRTIKYTVASADISGGKITLNFPELATVSDTITAIDLVNSHTYVATSDPLTTEIVKKTKTVGGSLYVYAIELQNATIPEGINVISVQYSVGNATRSEITNMRFAEFFNGANNNRVFIYGDGSNVCYYSGLTNNGLPTAEYFPAMNQISVGEKDAPITAMVRHFSRLICYKSTSAYSIQYDALVLEDGNVIAAFYLTPINRAIGNDAYGQVRIVNNNPIALYNGNIYEWRSNSSKSANLTYDERQARVISDRVEDTIKSFSLSECYCFDHDYEQEYYLCGEDSVLVYNYGNNTWYYYTNLEIKFIVDIDHILYFGMKDGTIRKFTRDAKSDYREQPTYETVDGESVMTDDGLDAIDAYWRSGSLSFDRDWKRKYSTVIWLGVMPERDSQFVVTAESDRKRTYPDKLQDFGTIGMWNVDFTDFSFGALKLNQLHRVKLKVKKYVFYNLVFYSNSKTKTATIVSTDIQVRFAGNAK